MKAEGRRQKAEGRNLPILRSAFCALRAHRFALALVSVIALTIFLAPLLRSEVFTLRDHFDYFQPLRWFTAQELRAGHLPLWNPYNASGEPWLANPQTGVFYPPAWLFLVLPFATAYMLFLLFHLLLLGWGAYLLFARTTSRGAAMVGAVALMLSGPVLSLLDVNNNLATLAWIPLVLWCAAERTPVAGGFALALAFLAGEPFLASVAAVMFVVVSRRPGEIAVAGVLAAGVSAIQLLPFLELIRGSDRAAGMAKESIFRDSMPLRDWIRVAWSWPDASGFDPALGQRFIPVVYMGVVVVLLAIVGSMRWRRAGGWLFVVLLAAMVASGPALLQHLPLTIFRYPSRLVPVAALAIAALAAIGWDMLRRDRRWVDLVLLFIIAGDLMWHARPLLKAEPFRRDVVPYPAAIGSDSKFLRVGDIDPRHRDAWISGYLNLYDRRFDAYTAAPLANDRYLRFHRRVLQKPSQVVLNALPAGWVLTSLALSAPLQPVARSANVTVYRNPSARPMAVVMTRDGIRGAHAEIGTSHARVTVDTAADGVLVLAQQDAPSWQVRIDGKEAKKRRIFDLFLGVDVPQGHHEVIWIYHPRSLYAGGAVTLATLLALQLFLFVKRRG